MCGACGAPPPDPAGALVAGPLRRAAVARAVAAACPGLTVQAVPGGWTVATRTGRTTVCRTLDALAREAGPYAASTTLVVAPARADAAGAAEAALEALRAAGRRAVRPSGMP
jgi:hypothetical protein